MNPRAFFRARLGHRIFAWLGATLTLTLVISGLLVWGLAQLLGVGPPLRLRPLQALVQRQLQPHWEAPAARQRQAEQLAADLGMHLELLDGQGALLSAHGAGVCGHPDWTLPVDPARPEQGAVRLCEQNPRHGLAFLLVLGLFAGALWLGSWLVARQIARPLRRLSRVAQSLGDGQLDARAPEVNQRPDEIGTLARTLHEMAARVEGQLRDQRTLLAAVSHELRTPLGHMQLLVELARERGTEPHHLDELARELHEMNELVDQLMATSRLQFKLEQTRALDPVQLALDALERAGLPPELLEVDHSADLQGDPSLLGRALANLLRNAQRHGQGTTRVHIDLSGDKLHLMVEDQGPGLPEAEQQRLFEPFVQGLAPNQAGSLGLGLFLARRIALAHGGQLLAENLHPGLRIGLVLPTQADKRA